MLQSRSATARYQSRTLVTAVLVCSILALSAVGLQVYQLSGWRAGPTVITQSSYPLADSSDAPHQGTKPVKLVAVKYQIDWCPKSKKTEPVFADLMLTYGNEPVLFTVFKMSDMKELERSKKMAERLGIDWLPKGPQQSGKIYLVQPAEKRILAVITNPGEKDAWEDALRNTLKF